MNGFRLGRALCVATLSIASFADTITDRALEQLRASPQISSESFDFVVIADTRSLSVTEQSETWKQVIQEVNVLKPAFIVDVGDLILGGSAEHVPEQWDEYERVVSNLEVPLFPVTGNHDISDAATERIWTERVGPLIYAFSYGNARFIALNSEEIGQVDRLSDEQVAWLKNDLETTDANHIFLFLHKPYFSNQEKWDERWGNVAAAIKGHPVRIVFGGDNHLYRYVGKIDGVDYVISAGGGAELRVPEDEGGFHHYVLVRVRGGEVSWSVIKPGAILPPDVVTQARIDEVRSARQQWIGTETVEVPVGEAFDRKVTIFIQNPYDKSYDADLAWKVPEGWTVDPPTQTYTARPKDITYLDATIRSNGPARFPVPTLVTTFNAAQYGDPIDVNRRLDLVPAYTIKRAAAPVAIDGDLAEWQSAEPMPLAYPWEFDIANTEDLNAKCRLMWDADNLYLAVEVHDDEFHQPYAGDIVWSADGIQLFINGRWEWGLTRTAAGPEVFLYKGVDREGETVNSAVHLAIVQNGPDTVYEAAFPKSELAPVELKPDSKFTFSIVANDLDPSHPDRPRHWVELTPGVGDAIPGSPMARIRMVE